MQPFYAQLNLADSVREELWNGKRSIVQTLIVCAMASGMGKVAWLKMAAVADIDKCFVELAAGRSARALALPTPI
jgi:hypothetical protein